MLGWACCAGTVVEKEVGHTTLLLLLRGMLGGLLFFVVEEAERTDQETCWVLGG